MVQKVRKAKPQFRERKVQARGQLQKYIKKKPKNQKTQRDNQHVFENFYDKLKQIDVKQSHLMEANFIYDNLLDPMDLDGSVQGGDDTFKSNFIQLLRTEKASNPTLEFNKIYKRLEGLCYSYPLLVHNKSKIVEVLISQLKENKVKVLQGCVIDLFIALIKDMRQDSYEDFIHVILPETIKIVDIQNVVLLDKIFTMISFAIKYLLKPIKDDIRGFYTIYYELLIHKNGHIRRFAAQSFSYVIRKLRFDDNLFKLLISPLENNNKNDNYMTDDNMIALDENNDKQDSQMYGNFKDDDHINGIADMIFEVVYGAAEGLHSKAEEVLAVILRQDALSDQLTKITRFVFLKLFNEVDTEKQSILLDILEKNLLLKDNEEKINLLVMIYKDLIKLKFGRRVSNYAVIQILEFLNNLLQKNNQICQNYSIKTKNSIADMMSLLYYYKFNQVTSVFSKSMIDISTSKNIFTYHIYKFKEPLPLIESLFGIFLLDHYEVQAQSDIDYAKLLNVKQSSRNEMEFSKESHVAKLKLLLPSLSKFVMKQLRSQQIHDDNLIEYITLLVALVTQTGAEYQFGVNKAIEAKIVQLLKRDASKNILAKFLLAKFINLLQPGQGEIYQYIQTSLNTDKKLQKGVTVNKIDLKQQICQNFILKNYKLEQNEISKFQTMIVNHTDIHNKGNMDLIDQQVMTMQLLYIAKTDKLKADTLISYLEKYSSDIIILKCFNQAQITSKLSFSKYGQLYKQLISNLGKNQIELRIQCLIALGKFEKLQFLSEESKENENVDAILTGDCELIDILLNFDKTENLFQTEKTKILILKKVQSYIESRLLPNHYLDLLYHFLAGCFWIKFTPLFPAVQQALAELIRNYPQEYALKAVDLLENIGYLTQLAHSNEELDELLQNAYKQSEQISQQEDNGRKSQIYLKEARLSEEYIEVKDVFYNITKCIGSALDVYMDDEQAKKRLFDHLNRFISHEYTLIGVQRSQSVNSSNLLDQMTYANMVESEDYKSYRRVSYSKLYNYLDMVKQANSLKKVPKVEELQHLLLKLINTNDTKLQKIALDCLIKTDYKKGLLRMYQKLLEGFTDDEKFKDMINVLNYGSQGANLAENEGAQLTKKGDKGSIPRLQQQHRLDILPIVIKLLLSKLIKKKGAINKKTIHIRRTIVFQFFASLDPQTEFVLFLNEILSPFNLDLASIELNKQKLQHQLSFTSFSYYLNFINQMEIIIKQMGNLLSQYLDKLAHVFVQILALSKMFLKQLKMTLVDQDQNNDNEVSNVDVEGDIIMGDSTYQNKSSSLYGYVGQQSKVCMRKGLAIVKQFYAKFEPQARFIADFSDLVYNEIIEDQLPLLKTQYITDGSQLVEILSLSWSVSGTSMQNYLRYPLVIPSIMEMLSQKKISSDVYQIHLRMIKNLILKSMDGDLSKSEFKLLMNVGEDNSKMDNEDQDEEMKAEVRKLAKDVLKRFNVDFAQNLHEFFKNHQTQLRQWQGMKQFKQRYNKNAANRQKEEQKKKSNDNGMQGNTIKDLVFIMSEIANYLEEGKEFNQDFLNTMISIVSIKNLHKQSDFFNAQYEEILYYGCRSIVNLIPKLATVDEFTIDQLFQLFLILRTKKVREQYSLGLLNLLSQKPLSNKLTKNKIQIRQSVLEQIRDLNKIKKGAADIELDYDQVILTIQQLLQEKFEGYSNLEISCLAYNIIFIVQDPEFTVRDYAQHLIYELLQKIKTLKNDNLLNLVPVIEKQLVSYINIRDEMILKTVLVCIRDLIVFFKESGIKSVYSLISLVTIVDPKDENCDFFVSFMAIKMKQRQKALKMVIKMLESDQINDYKAFNAVILPLVNSQIFGGKNQQKNRQDTISYSAEQKRQTLEEGLNVYQALAAKLKWPEYYKMLKTLLFKLGKAQTKATSVSSTDPELALEKIVTKCICKMLSGFNFSIVPDAVDILQKQQEDERDTDMDFSDLLQKLVGHKKPKTQAILEEEDDNKNTLEIAEEILSDDENEEEKPDTAKITAIETQKADYVEDIQNKLAHKVLPILERHLREKNSEDTVRAFVVLSIARVIRKLPLDKFQNLLTKLVNQIVVHGLRSRDLAPREKARKALVKLVLEISPKFLAVVFEEMQAQLTKGYQLHIYQFSVHYILNGLIEDKKLVPGSITNKIIEISSGKLMDEIFGDLAEEKALQDTAKKHSKESKARKAMPTYEIFAQYIDFEKNFLTLISPIVRSLEENPSFNKIQLCEDLLNRISTSLMKNQTIKGDQMLVFMFTIIQRGVLMASKLKINDEKEMRDYGAKVMDQEVHKMTKKMFKESTYGIEMKWKKAHQLNSEKKTVEVSGRALASFGLQCLKKGLKSKGLILNKEAEHENDVPELAKEELRAKLDPFVLLLLNTFKTYHNPIIVTTLNVLTQIIRLNLPSFNGLLKKFLNRIFKLFELNHNADSDFLNSLFKCTSELIKTFAVYQDISQLQIKALIRIIKDNINNHAIQNNVFSCLKAIIYRKFLNPDLYDLIETVQDMMITNISKSVRGVCAAIFVQFLLEYPLEGERVEQHINHLIKNLAYFDSEGRMQLLEVLQSLIDKFPKEILDQFAELLFFTLMLRSVNDNNSACREKISFIIKKLLKKIDSNKVKSLLTTILQMDSQNEQKRLTIQQAKLSVLSIFIESQQEQKQLKQSEIVKIIDICEITITEQVKIIMDKIAKSKHAGSGDEDETDQEDSSIKNSQMALFLQAIDLNDPQSRQVQEVLDSDHSTNEWTSLYYALLCIEKLFKSSEIKGFLKVLMKHDFVKQISLLSDKHYHYWIKLICQRMLSSMLTYSETAKIDLQTVLNYTESKQISDLMYFQLNMYKVQPMTVEFGDIINNNNTHILRYLLSKPPTAVASFSLAKIFSKLSYIGRKVMLNILTAKERIQQIIQFYLLSINLFEEISQMKDNIHIREVMTPILELVYRIYTDEQYQESAAKSLALEIVDYFTKNIEKTFFINTYNDVKKSIQERRQGRKQKQKVLQATDEGQVIMAKKRMHKMQKKKEKKHEKVFQQSVRKN